LTPAFEILKRFDIPFETHISSAHRTPHRTIELVSLMENRGVKVIIAAAGLAAHLPGVIASHTTVPVIGIPMASGTLSGLDALLAIVQMPPGIPVGTVGIGENGAYNAALLAIQIMALSDANIANLLNQFRHQQKMRVYDKDQKLQNNGWENY
jgi:5-(carboxyamino)imidazole ribonucleotide mutase